MFKIGDYILDKKTNQKCLIISYNKNFYLIKNINGVVEGKFEWELEKYNFIKYIIRRIKNARIK